MLVASAGHKHSCFISARNTVWVCGTNGSGQHGTGDKTENKEHILVEVRNLIKINTVVCGFSHTLCIDIENKVFGFGNNREHQLGTGKPDETLTPALIQGLPEIQSVAAGNHSLCLDFDGIIWGFGLNSNGQCGKIGETISVPTILSGVPKIQSVHCGYAFTIAVDVDGELWSFGSNLNGQLGIVTNSYSNPPQKIPNIINPLQVSLGYGHTVILDSNNDVWVCGYNSQGQLGLNNKIDVKQLTRVEFGKKVKHICSGYFHTFIRAEDGCYFCGNNNFYQAGFSHNTAVLQFTKLPYENLVPLALGGLHNMYYNEDDDQYYGCGWNDCGQALYDNELVTADYRFVPISYDNLVPLFLNNRAKSARK